MALKNNIPQIPSVLPYVDLAVNEQCFQYKRVPDQPERRSVRIRPDGRGGKAVFETEYKAYSPTNNVCAASILDGFSTIYKDTALELVPGVVPVTA